MGETNAQTRSALAVKLAAVSDLIRLPRQYGTLLLLWPTLWSLFIASGGRPSARHLVVFVLGTFLMRSAGCAINDIADRNFDPHVERTRTRPLASGRLGVKEAVFVFCALSVLAFCLVLLLNRLTIYLSFVGILLAAVYPFVKRVSHLPQAFLGMAVGWGSVMAWSAVTGTVGLAGVLIFAANVFWSTAYDTVYALMDKEDDLRVGVKSTAILFGRRVYSALALLYVGFTATLGAAGWVYGASPIFYAGITAALGAFLYTVAALRKNPDRQAAFNAFLANAAVGGFVLAAIIADLNL